MGKLSPLMEQFFNIKEKYGDYILFFRVGDFYEMFYDDALRNIKIFNDAGFDFFESGISQISINAIPSVVSQESVIDLFMDVLHLIQSKKAELITEREEKLMKMLACRCAIKGGRACKTEEMIHLLGEWVKSRDVDYCPHGRPVMRKFAKSDFDKLFKRIK